MNTSICTQVVTGAVEQRAICAVCGHQAAMHPGMPNPTLEACVACVVVHTADPKRFLWERRRWEELEPTSSIGVGWVLPVEKYMESLP